MKKVSIGAKPSSGQRKVGADAWVESRTPAVEPVEAAVEKMKRLTIDVSRKLHKRIKSECALQDLQMADVIRDLLEERFPE